MTEANQTAVVKTDGSDIKQAAKLHPAVLEARVRSALVQQLRGTQWGRDLSHEALRAVAEYAHRRGMDPVSEIDILGGRIYENARYFERRGAEMIAAGEVEYIRQEHIEADPRLDELARCDIPEEAEWARREIVRRLRLRVEHNAKEQAAAVVVTRIKVPGLEEEIVGCNWCGNGVRKGDPVGDAEPSKTAETRSARRAWKQLVKVVPGAGPQQDDPDADEDGGVKIAAMIREDREEAKRQAKEMEPKALMEVSTNSAYGIEDDEEDLFPSGEDRSAASEPADLGLDDVPPSRGRRNAIAEGA